MSNVIQTDIDNVLLTKGKRKKKSIFKDIIQIKVDHPPSYTIFDK